MTKALQHLSSVSGTRRSAVALALAVVLVLLALTQSAQAQTYTILYSFIQTDGQAEPWGPLIFADGILYGSFYPSSSVFTFDLNSGTETLFSKSNLQSYSGVIRDPAGNLYGTTITGGTANRGTIFKVDSTGTRSVLHSFGRGARFPDGGLTVDAKGNLYGTAQGGAFHAGIVFKLGEKGRYTILYNFCAKPGCSDGKVR